MRIQLPNEKSAVITEQGDLSEGACREIEAAYIDAVQTAGKLKRMGKDFDANVAADDPQLEEKLEELYQGVTQADREKVRFYEGLLIVKMLKSWDVDDDLPTIDTVLEMPRKFFNVLAAECSKEFNKTEPVTEGEPDPKVSSGS